MAEPLAARPIAVITVCRNPGAQLHEALASVFALADPRVHAIVIDGASTDGTPAWLQANGARLHHWRSEPDAGIYDAMNKGWASAPADAWVLFLGADDRLLQLPAAAELAAAEAAGAGIVYGTTTLGGRDFRSRLDGTIRFRNTLHHQSMLVGKALAPEPPFDTTLRVYGDWDFNARLWRQGVHAMYVATLRAQAAPGGASAARPVAESFRVGRRHGGWAGGLAAGALALLGQRHRARAPRAGLTIGST